MASKFVLYRGDSSLLTSSPLLTSEIIKEECIILGEWLQRPLLLNIIPLIVESVKRNPGGGDRAFLLYCGEIYLQLPISSIEEVAPLLQMHIDAREFAYKFVREHAVSLSLSTMYGLLLSQMGSKHIPVPRGFSSIFSEACKRYVNGSEL